MREINPGLSKLLRRYQLGKCTEEAERVIDQWFNSIHHEIADKPLGENANRIKERIWEDIQLAAGDGKLDTVSLLEHRKWWSGWQASFVAACLLFVVGFALYEFQDGPIFGGIAGSRKLKMKLISNHDSRPKRFELADRSFLTLEPGSSAYLADDFGKVKRDVYLKGSGFFQVSHDKEKPFVVYAGKITTRVLGTSFGIRRNAGNTEVEVVTGKVAVEKTGGSGPNGQGVVLTPNQKVIFEQASDNFKMELVKEPVLINRDAEAVPVSIFNFDDAPLSEVVGVLEASYGIKILIRNEQIKNCPIKAELGHQPLYAKLDIICAALQSHYDVKGTSIIISGGQCD